VLAATRGQTRQARAQALALFFERGGIAMTDEIRKLRGIVREAEECFTLLQQAYDHNASTLYDAVKQVLNRVGDA
jgi:hypothetical protein